MPERPQARWRRVVNDLEDAAGFAVVGVGVAGFIRLRRTQAGLACSSALFVDLHIRVTLLLASKPCL